MSSSSFHPDIEDFFPRKWIFTSLMETLECMCVCKTRKKPLWKSQFKFSEMKKSPTLQSRLRRNLNFKP